MHEYMWVLYSHLREYRKIILRVHFPHVSQILEGVHFGANTCRACIRTRAIRRENNPGELFMYWFRARGYSFPLQKPLSPTPPRPNPTPRPGTDPKRSQTEPNGPEQSQTEPKWTEIRLARVGQLGGFVGMEGGGGDVREKENHYPKGPKIKNKMS